MTPAEDDFEAQLTRASRRRRVVLGVLAVATLGVFGWFVLSVYRRAYPTPRPIIALSPEQRAQLVAEIRMSREALVAADRPWRAQVTAVSPRDMPEDAPRCTRLDFYAERLALHPQNWRGWELGREPFSELGERLSVTSHGSWSLTTVPYPLVILPPDAPLPEHSAELSFRLAEIEREEQQLDRPQFASFDDRLARVRFNELYATEVMLRLIGSMTPRADPGRHVTTFEPGALVVEGWMYDHRANRVVCAGVVGVESSTVVDLRSTGLNEDLIVNLIRRAPGELSSLH